MAAPSGYPSPYQGGIRIPNETSPQNTADSPQAASAAGPSGSPPLVSSSAAGGASQKRKAADSIAGTRARSTGSSGNERRPPRKTFFDQPSIRGPSPWYIRVSIS